MSADNPMSFYRENVDAWGPLEWFDRLAKAVHARSQAVRDKDDIAFETYKNIASSSATRLVSDFEDKVRMALTTLRELEKANVAYVDANTELLATLDGAHAEENRLRTIALDMQAGYREAIARAEATEKALESLCAWLLHRFGPDSPEGREASCRMSSRTALASTGGEHHAE